MNRFRISTGVLVLVIAALSASTSQAFFHQWKFSEIFSNSDGTVQFIEMTTAASTETLATGVATMQIRSTAKTFTFNHNLTGNTANKRILIAISGFESKPGLPTMPPLLTPDYTLAANFFTPASDTLRFCQNACTGSAGNNIYDTKTLTSLPTNGVTSIHYPPAAGSLLDNSPTNYAGTTGSLTAPPSPTGDYNGDGEVNTDDYTNWRDTLGQAAVPAGSGADGDADGMIDDGDYDFWKSNFGDVVPGAGAGNSTAAPEPTALLLAIIGLLALELASNRRGRSRA